MPRAVKDWLKVLVLLLDEVAAVALVFLVLWLFDIRIPLFMAIVAALLLGAIAFLIHRAVVPSFHVRQATGSEAMIGLEGEAVEPLTPHGVVKVQSEYWQAKSINGEIAKGEIVEVAGLNKLVLYVRRMTPPED
jgi:membrane-bound ClpP family serine protease